MSIPRSENGDSSRDQVVAGEYVLGVLSAEDRRKVEARMVLDRNFAAMVDHWQSNLSSFDADYEPVVPPAAVKVAIERRLFADAPAGNGMATAGGLWNSLALWRGLSIISFAGLLTVAGFNAGLLNTPAATNPLVAELDPTKDGQADAINLVAHYEATTGRLRVTPVAARQPQEKSLELWLVEGDAAPVSIGVLPQSGEGEVLIPEALRKRLTAGTTLAVSVEPPGGSPTGSATGPVIALGKTHRP